MSYSAALSVMVNFSHRYIQLYLACHMFNIGKEVWTFQEWSLKSRRGGETILCLKSEDL